MGAFKQNDFNHAISNEKPNFGHDVICFSIQSLRIFDGNSSEYPSTL